MCMNKRALVGLGAGIGGLLLVNPAWGAAALPLLVFALCPLMMFVMMRGMGGAGSTCEKPSSPSAEGLAAAESADERIASLQAQLRELKAAQAASEAGAIDRSRSSETL